jgi:AAA+ superfamily predicted ATPase
MRELGWRGPRLMRWGKKTLKGYWRYPTVGLPVIVQEEPVVEVATTDRETLAPELERVTRLGLQKLEQILRIPTDRGDGNLLRAQTAAAGLAVNAQLRADETRMKQVGRRDVLERLLAMIAEEKAKLAEEERLERGETEGSVNSGIQ